MWDMVYESFVIIFVYLCNNYLLNIYWLNNMSVLVFVFKEYVVGEGGRFVNFLV